MIGLENKELLIKSAKALDIHLTDHQVKQFAIYYKLLIEWNKKFNLTAITDEKEVITKHFIDSIALLKVSSLTKVSRMIDIGTGAGFPGIPLKIVAPDVELTLLDSLKKRVAFLEEVIMSLGMEDVKCLHGRAEDFGRLKDYRETYDLCVSRAVAHLSVLSEYCIPFVRINGCFISYKSNHIDEEILESQTAIKHLGGVLDKTIPLKIPDSNIVRNYILIKKVKRTVDQYPRKAGLPAKKPLR